MKEIIDELNNYLNNSNVDSNQNIITDKYNKFVIDKTKFFKIKSQNIEKKICFIDGGSTTLFESPSFCIGFIKTVAVTYLKKKVMGIKINKLFTFSYALNNSNNEIVYKTNFFQFDNKSKVINGFELNSKTNILTTYNENFKISKSIDIARRIAELDIANELLNNLEAGDIIMIDGTLKTFFDSEENLIQKLYKNALQNNILISSILKTNNSITDNGKSVIGLISNNSPSYPWFYDNFINSIEITHKAQIYFLKLHKKSEYVFTLEIYNEQAKIIDINKIIGFFAYYSNDAVFLGYPYGLIKADSLARVTNNEKDMLITQITIKNQRLFEKIKPFIKSIDAHNILDKISF
jgi:hypothetical protein